MNPGGSSEFLVQLPQGRPTGLPPRYIPPARSMVRTTLPLPAGQALAWVDQLLLAPGLMVLQAEVRPGACREGQVLPVGDFRLGFTEPTLVVHTLHAGSVARCEADPHCHFLPRPAHDLIRYVEHGSFVPLLDTSCAFTRTALLCTERALGERIGEAACQQLLLDLRLDAPGKVCPLQVPPHVSEPLRQCLDSGASGMLHALHAESKILDYLWMLATFAGSTRQPGGGGDRELGIVRSLHAYLLHLEGAMPTLKELGERFGMSPHNLNKAYLSAYGQSIFAMAISHRLNRAHLMLSDGRLAIKTIALRVGYSHVNHFIHAFRMRFGYTPGSSRRGPRTPRRDPAAPS